MSAPIVVRRATRGDLPEIVRIRLAVRENRLSDPARVTEQDLIDHLERVGCGFVASLGGSVAGFAFARRVDGNVWALFVDPDHEGRGVGALLHEAMLEAFHAWGIARAWLTTTPGTRAERFYRARGWSDAGRSGDEIRLERTIEARGAVPGPDR